MSTEVIKVDGVEMVAIPKKEYEAQQRELADYREQNERDKAQMKRRLTEIEAGETRSSDSESTGNGDENDSDDDLLPIERLIEGENRDDWYVGRASESVERAKELFRHFEDWSAKAPKGRVIKTAGKKRGTSSLKNLLNAVLDGPDLAWKQVYRACVKLEEWTKGTIEFIDHGRYGKMLVMSEPSSSVAHG